MPTEAEVLDALRPVEDPEIHQSIVDLDMVRGSRSTGDQVGVTVALTVAGCPLRAEITKRVTDAVSRARRRGPRRRRPHGHDRRGARRARRAPPRRRRPLALARGHGDRRRASEHRPNPFIDSKHARARDRVGQGWRRQVVGHHQPRGRARAARPPRRRRRRRRLGLLDAAHARHRPAARPSSTT